MTQYSDEQFVGVEIRIINSILGKLMMRSLDERLQKWNTGISAMHYGMLRMLRHNEHTMSELSKLFMLDPSSMVPIVDQMENLGYIVRTRDPHDRRRMPLHVTNKAITLLDNVNMLDEADDLQNGLAQMGETKSLQLLSLMRELVQRMPEGSRMLLDAQKHLYSRAPDDVRQRLQVEGIRGQESNDDIACIKPAVDDAEDG